MGFNVQELPQTDWLGLENVPGMAALISEFNKALEAGDGVNAATYADGRALGYENLDPMLQSVTLVTEDHTLWRALPKRSIHATVDQWNRRSSFAKGGSRRWGHAVGESEASDTFIADLFREYATVKYFRDRREVSDIILKVNNTVDPYVEEQQSGTLALLESISDCLYFGNSAVVPKQFDGMFTVLGNSANSVPTENANGRTLTSRTPLDQLMARVRTNGGRLTHAFAPPLCQADLSGVYESAERLAMLQAPQNGSPKWYAGAAIAGVITAQGILSFEGDPFNLVGWACPSASEGPNPPAAPTSVGIQAVGGTGGLQPTGAYFYKVTAVNARGQSVGTASLVANVTLGQKVTLRITRSDANTTGYFIYRSALNASDAADCRYLTQCACTGATDDFVDGGEWVPGTAHIPILDLRQNAGARAVQWSQLMPMTMKRLAETSVTKPFIMTLAGVLRFAAPEWCALYKNILPQYVLDEGWDPLGVYA